MTSTRTLANIESDDLACWLLFYLEAHGATITLTPAQNVHVDLNTMPGLTAGVVDRWAPVIDPADAPGPARSRVAAPDVSID
jgi:hypothetical protein